MSYHKDLVADFLECQRTGKGHDGIAKRVAKKHKLSVSEVKATMREEDLLARLEGQRAEHLAPILDAMYERAMVDQKAAMDYLGFSVPEKFDPGVRRQRIANEAKDREMQWEIIDVKQTPVTKSEHDPLLIADGNREEGSSDT